MCQRGPGQRNVDHDHQRNPTKHDLSEERERTAQRVEQTSVNQPLRK